MKHEKLYVIAHLHSANAYLRIAKEHLKRLTDHFLKTDMLEIPIEDAISLSIQTERALQHGGIKTIGQLLNCTRQDLRTKAKISKRSLDEIEEVLERFGLMLGSKIFIDSRFE